MLFHSPFGLTARGRRPLSCIAVDKIAQVWCGEYPRRSASCTITEATSRGVESGVSLPDSIPALDGIAALTVPVPLIVDVAGIPWLAAMVPYGPPSVFASRRPPVVIAASGTDRAP